jgi:hypothetical protein
MKKQLFHLYQGYCEDHDLTLRTYNMASHSTAEIPSGWWICVSNPF